MAHHLVVGKGPIGTLLAARLLGDGQEVVVVSRSGGAPAEPAPRLVETGRGADRSRGAVRYERADATDPAALTRLARGATAIHNCVNPAYHRWPVDWPPVAEALLRAAADSGAVLVTAGNLYGYGRGTHPMREDSPLATRETKGRVRAAMWEEALRRHEAGHLRATEVRGSDYVGPLALDTAHAGARLMQPLLAGRPVRPIGSADQPHSWTYLPDFAAALAAAARTEAAWGRPWHVPSPEPLTFRELVARMAGAAGVAAPPVRPIPVPVVRAVGVVSPMLRETAAMAYQMVEPFVLDSSRSEEVLDLRPTGWDEIAATTVAWWRARVS